MSKVGKEYIPKWRLSMIMHDKMMEQWKTDKAARDKEALDNPSPPKAKALISYEEFERELLEGHDYKEGLPTGTTTFDDWAYDNLLITYEELKERKNNG